MGDPLLALRRLRSLEVLDARRALAERQAAVQAAERAAAESEARLGIEAAVAAASPRGGADYAAWAPLGRAARDRSAAASAAAGEQAEAGRLALAGHRAAENAVERLIEMQREAKAVAAKRKFQALLDEIGGRRR
ncbi:hypothetical protein [Roseicella aquatilis]|uniref:hypothetical protein n=1 Tax=Roseicella aquatilis TaxID=2527868 RepID=UPI00140494FE|nr:hypothetical protein [Roseicella aquatilis]